MTPAERNALRRATNAALWHWRGTPAGQACTVWDSPFENGFVFYL